MKRKYLAKVITVEQGRRGKPILRERTETYSRITDAISGMEQYLEETKGKPASFMTIKNSSCEDEPMRAYRPNDTHTEWSYMGKCYAVRLSLGTYPDKWQVSLDRFQDS